MLESNQSNFFIDDIAFDFSWNLLSKIGISHCLAENYLHLE